MEGKTDLADDGTKAQARPLAGIKPACLISEAGAPNAAGLGVQSIAYRCSERHISIFSQAWVVPHDQMAVDLLHEVE